MADVYNPRVARVTLRGALHGSEIQNVLHFAIPVDVVNAQWDLALLTLLGEQVSAQWTANIVPQQSEEYQFRGWTARHMSGPAGLSVEAVAAPVPGGRTQVSSASNVAACMTLFSTVGGRSGRGRLYIAGLPESEINLSRMSPLYVQALNGAAADFLALVNAPNWQFVVYSKFTAGQPRAQGVPYGVLSMGLRDDIVDSQRRRLPGRGA